MLIARSTAELEEIIRRQESLVQSLRGECRNLMQQLEAVSHKYKYDVLADILESLYICDISLIYIVRI